jgi:capsular exopolysaccharide synthesis family protein
MEAKSNNNPPGAQGYSPGSYTYDSSVIREEDGIDLKRYLSLFFSNWYWFAIALFIALSIAYGINRWSDKTYSVSASLLIADEEFGGNMGGTEQFIPGGDIFKSRQNLDNEIGILKSFKLNLEVMKELPEFWVTITAVGKRGIVESVQYKNTPFTVVFDSLKHQRIGTRIDIELLSDEKYRIIIGDFVEKELKFGEQYKTDYYDFRIIKPNGVIYDKDKSNKYYFRFESLEGLANRYRGKLSISPISDEASLVTLTTSGSSILQETDYLNKLMEVYIKEGLSLKNKTADNTIVFIEEQLGLISDSLQLAESKLERFRLNNELIDLSSEASLLQSRIERFENEKYAVQFEKEYYEYLLEYINTRDESGEIVSPSLVGITDPTLSRLVSELAGLQHQKKQLLFSLRDDLPAINLIDSNISGARKILKENVENSLTSATRMLDDANARINRVEAEIQKLPGTERQLINIQRNFDLNNTVYNYLLEKRAEAGIARASNVSDNRIIDQAATFNASLISPKEKKNYTFAFVLGLLIPAGLLFLFDVLNNKIIDRSDIEKVTDIPVLGFIGHSNTRSELAVVDNPGSTLAESFRSIRTKLKYFSPTDSSRIIAVTSTVSGEGKSFISVNIASIIAMLGKKVLLVGLDLRKPKLHKILETDNITGLTSWLIGEAGYEEVIFETKIDNLFFAPSGPVPPNPSELIASDKMKDFFTKARQDFDYIIVDTPPVAIVTDTLLLTPYIDINLFVVRQRYSSKNTLDLINELKDLGELKNMAILINDISLTGYYGYGLRYGNSLGYRGYYYGYNLYGAYGYRKYGYGNKGQEYYTNNL